MTLSLHWIEAPTSGRLAISPRPSPAWLAEDLEEVADKGVHAVVSLLEPEEVRELGLGEQAAVCEGLGMDFTAFPIPDRGVPTLQPARELATLLATRLRAGEGVLIHCRAGIGRSSVMAACVLASLGLGADDALERIAAARRTNVPDTEDQRAWIIAFRP